jgi:hypothetical protein
MEEMFKEFDTDKDEYILESDILKVPSRLSDALGPCPLALTSHPRIYFPSQIGISSDLPECAPPRLLTLHVLPTSQMLIKHRDEPMYPDSVENWEKPTDEALAESAREVGKSYCLLPRFLFLFVTLTFPRLQDVSRRFCTSEYECLLCVLSR